MIPILEADNGDQLSLFYFAVGGIERQREADAQRGIYSPTVVVTGDGEYAPFSLRLRGIVKGNGQAGMFAAKDEVQAMLRRSPLWLLLGERRIRVGRTLDETEGFEDRIHDDTRRMEYTLQALRPFWEAHTRQEVTSALIEGSTDVALTIGGTAVCYPEIEITGTGVTQVVMSSGGRAFTWSGSALGASSLVVDCMNGRVTVGGINRIAEVQDASAFLELEPGSRSITFELTGGSGNATIRFRNAFY